MEQQVPFARNSQNNLYFEESVIYSYGKHYPIAWLGLTLVLFNCFKSSVTTGKHRCWVRQAAEEAGLDVVEVPFPMLGTFRAPEANLSYFGKQIVALNLKAKACPRLMARYMLKADEILAQVRTYCVEFKIDPPCWTWADTLSTLAVAIEVDPLFPVQPKRMVQA